jgi:hypothetical protein
MLRMTLILAIVSLLVWVYFGFVHPVGVGAIHVLLAIGVMSLVRWIALSDLRSPSST